MLRNMITETDSKLCQVLVEDSSMKAVAWCGKTCCYAWKSGSCENVTGNAKTAAKGSISSYISAFLHIHCEFHLL